MGDVTTIGLDIAKASFQAHGADASGAVVLAAGLAASTVSLEMVMAPPCLESITFIARCPSMTLN
jgi:hypothetical protein